MAYFNGKEWVSSTTPYTPPKPKPAPKPTPKPALKPALKPTAPAPTYSGGAYPGNPGIPSYQGGVPTAPAGPSGNATPIVGGSNNKTPEITGVPGLTQADLDAALAKNNAQWQAQLDMQNPYDDMIADITRYQKEYADAVKSEAKPFEHPDLVDDSARDDEKIL